MTHTCQRGPEKKTHRLDVHIPEVQHMCQKTPIFMERNLQKRTADMLLHIPTRTARHGLCHQHPRYVSKETCICQKRPTKENNRPATSHTHSEGQTYTQSSTSHVCFKRDLYIRKETYKRKQARETSHIHSDGQTCALTSTTHVCLKRDLYMPKETCICQKRPVYAKRDLYMPKETCICQKRPVYARRDLYMPKETY